MVCGAISESLESLNRKEEQLPPREPECGRRFRGPYLSGLGENTEPIKSTGLISQSEMKRFATGP